MLFHNVFSFLSFSFRIRPLYAEPVHKKKGSLQQSFPSQSSLSAASYGTGPLLYRQKARWKSAAQSMHMGHMYISMEHMVRMLLSLMALSFFTIKTGLIIVHNALEVNGFLGKTGSHAPVKLIHTASKGQRGLQLIGGQDFFQAPGEAYGVYLVSCSDWVDLYNVAVQVVTDASYDSAGFYGGG